MRTVKQQGLNLIKRFEGFSSTIYICPAGYDTIGYGHLVRSAERRQFEQGITEQQAESILRQDVKTAEHAVLRLIHVPLTDGQFDALTSFTFNLGSGALQSSTLRRVINREQHDQAPAQYKAYWTSCLTAIGIQAPNQSLETQSYPVLFGVVTSETND